MDRCALAKYFVGIITGTTLTAECRQDQIAAEVPMLTEATARPALRLGTDRSAHPAAPDVARTTALKMRQAHRLRSGA